MRNKNVRKTVEIGSKRIPLRKLLHGKEIREAAKAIEDFRLHFKEEEILMGAKLHLKWGDYNEAHLVATRLETDQEFSDRLEKQRLAEEAKQERARIRKLREQERARLEEENRKERIANHIRDLAKSNGLTSRDLETILKLES